MNKFICLNCILNQYLCRLKSLSLYICFLILADHHNITHWLLGERARLETYSSFFLLWIQIENISPPVVSQFLSPFLLSVLLTPPLASTSCYRTVRIAFQVSLPEKNLLVRSCIPRRGASFKEGIKHITFSWPLV